MALIITVFGAIQKPCRYSQIRSKKNKGPMEMVMMFIGIEAESERTLKLLTWTSEPPACGQDLAGRPCCELHHCVASLQCYTPPDERLLMARQAVRIVQDKRRNQLVRTVWSPIAPNVVPASVQCPAWRRSCPLMSFDDD